MNGSDAIRGISQMIIDSYPTGLDWESLMHRRLIKITEEAGEVVLAWLGYLGENPRKGKTHGMVDVREELLDVALAALGAWCQTYNNQEERDPLLHLTRQAVFKHERLKEAMAR